MLTLKRIIAHIGRVGRREYPCGSRTGLKRLMVNSTLLQRIRLGPSHRVTGKTRHYDGNRELAAPSELQIVKYQGDEGYYLLYLDERGHELTDTYHDNVAEAKAQAEWEFEIGPDEWEVLEQS